MNMKVKSLVACCLRKVPSACVLPVLLVLCLFSTLMAQPTYFEGFDDDGDGVRYNLDGRYFIRFPGLLFTTVPFEVPGVPIIAGWDTGDLLSDGTGAPARRATYFAEHQTGDITPGLGGSGNFLTDAGWDLTTAAVQWAANSTGNLNILYGVDELFPTAFDLELEARLTSVGHTVTKVRHEDLDSSTAGSFDLIFLNSSNAPPTTFDPGFGSLAVPIVTGLFHEAVALNLGDDRGDNTNGTTSLDIVDGSHPLAAGFPNGPLQVIEDVTDRQRLTIVTRGEIAAGAHVVAKTFDQMIEAPSDLIGFEGAGYLRVGRSNGAVPNQNEPRIFESMEIDLTGVTQPRLSLSLSATRGPNDSFVDDFIQIFGKSGGNPYQLIGELNSNLDGNLEALDGTVLTNEFQTLSFDIPTALGDSSDFMLKIETKLIPEARFSVGIDSLTISQIPEPTTIVMSFFAVAGVGAVRRVRRKEVPGQR
ncbi:hypothetical protein [Bythopirellula polymerisocia]|uniref:PEP-CTERM protein-sorting domain-containing protein n=1 Tax=Bythopirellula polymerisocia TaxID=2528003 RepID=A0A5C6CYN0_9BACT|nr:hypothetical protein [Bythopirellula polymerisocia]TWU28704.1 hypothetical protein Pla144_19960 [Bythopirellula polymerisocia]